MKSECTVLLMMMDIAIHLDAIIVTSHKLYYSANA